ncbi:MAG: hypothetical protein COU46_01170 [Candidatus Niyogibacteria bacterium CG10_big_fil_rev_8_21_14_0_10_42_19]|uniref:Uncharacterized protein n=1 Tax=Candidatus Niyogibacteria bacterium CG10_big_fil_rev_8_21_14_0_10_42_19 TaxID=1974725 RepID=A0A2H0TG11_9BACT|nr:MAG: hypothetical protein COU46_01170 [Candidatus Niyogibacteria bacterium CG10_big_fil_rev_8_21_14_0_10_42_19]
MKIRRSELIKEKARKLRSYGKTYSEIIRDLGLSIPKSTLSSWCNDVVLPVWYQEKVNRLNAKNFTKAQKTAWASNKIKRERFLSDLIQKNDHLYKKIKDKDILKMLLAMLYLGEGSKWKSHRGLMLGSSDPDIIKLYMRLLYLCYGIGSKDLKCYICYRADQNINKLHRYWSHTTLIPLENFYSSKPDPRTIGKKTMKKNYMGVCVLTCGGTHIQLELEEIPRIILKGL